MIVLRRCKTGRGFNGYTRGHKLCGGLPSESLTLLQLSESELHAGGNCGVNPPEGTLYEKHY